jgi:hypothetical protein
MNRITPLLKGLITGTIMIAVSLLLNYSGKAAGTTNQYLFYVLYAAGIAWALLAYYRSPNYKPTFGSIFNQGFRCFIIISLVTVIFTGIYTSMHPEIAEQAAVAYRADLVQEGKRTPTEIDEMVKTARDRFVTGNISLAAFGTLITGALFTAAGAGLLLMRRN